MPRLRSHLIGRTPWMLTALLLMMGVLAAVAPSAVARPGAPCRVTNLATEHVYRGTGSNLQRAIDAAGPGGRLRVRGVCVGTFSVHRTLSLIGWATAAFPTPTLDGDGAGTVLTIGAGSVVLRNMRVTDGNAAQYFGGGIDNEGTLTLVGATAVSGNTGDFGSGGIFNGGTLRMDGSSSVSGNTSDAGGGIYNDGTLVMNGRSSVWGNDATTGGGIYANFGAVTTMNDASSISGNSAAINGGGIYNNARLTLNGWSSVRGNSAFGDGGGIDNADLSHLRMTGNASITANTASDAGGGIWNAIFGHLRHAIAGANVSGNTPDDIFQEEE